MNQYLLLILLTSWSLVITHLKACDTVVAFTNSILSVSRSSLANADVALLEAYTAGSVEKCMEDCCSGKYGDCTVASFKGNSTQKNCLLFNCRPLKQCKFLSSNTTDSFTFSSGTHVSHPVPSTPPLTISPTKSSDALIISPKAKSHSEQEQPYALEEIATYSDELADLKNDNTSVKPRKGVVGFTPDTVLSKSGIKPRKGVTLEDVPHSNFLLKGLNKSNVKPRKGVKMEAISENVNVTPTSSNDLSHTKLNASDDISDNELVLELQKLFEDDPLAASTVSSISATATSEWFTISPTSSLNILAAESVANITSFKINPSFSNTPLSSSNHIIESRFSSTPSLTTSTIVHSSFKEITTSVITKSSPLLVSEATGVPLLSANAHAHVSLEEPKTVDKSLEANSEESESDRKYKSSIHVVLSLVFGLVVLFAVLGVVAKRMYDSWQRRDYYRMNYLIDGIYNGYD